MDSTSATREACEMMQGECEEQATAADSLSGAGEECALGPLLLLQRASHTLPLLVEDVTARFAWVTDVYDGANTISETVNSSVPASRSGISTLRHAGVWMCHRRPSKRMKRLALNLVNGASVFHRAKVVAPVKSYVHACRVSRDV